MNKALMSIFTSLWLFSTSDFAQVRELPAPAGRGSGQPNLAVAPDGRVYLSWIERLGEGRFSLRFALLVQKIDGVFERGAGAVVVLRRDKDIAVE
jgi:hypothetical protein